MRPFDRNTYLKEVLAPFNGSSGLPDLFERYLLDYTDADGDEIELRLAEVKSFWDKKQNQNPKYEKLLGLLREDHGAAGETLKDVTKRARLADEIEAQTQAWEEESKRRIIEWEATVARYIARDRGLSPNTRAQLKKAGEWQGVPKETIDRCLHDAPDKPFPQTLDESTREPIRKALASLAQAEGNEALATSLFHALGLQITEDTALAEERIRERAELNRKGSADHTKKAWDAVLGDARKMLVQSDPRAYIEGLVDDTVASIYPSAVAKNSDGRIDEREAKQLKEEVIDLGLTPELADRALAKVATELGAQLRTGVEVDYIACPHCSKAHDRVRKEKRCSRCWTELLVTCPAASCDQVNDATSARCSACGTDLHRFLEAKKQLDAVAKLLDAGRLKAARAAVAEAKEIVGDAEVEQASARVAKVEQEARRLWANAEEALAQSRRYEARRILKDLADIACDEDGPSGLSPDREAERNATRIDAAEKELQAARSLTGTKREARLARVLELAADCTEAITELDRIPPSPPSSVTVKAAGKTKAISWSASSSQGVSYEVSRGTVGSSSVVIGEVRSLHFEDAGAAAGDLVTYAVVAIRGKARSAAARSEELLVIHDVGEPVAANGDGVVHLSWSPPGAGRIVVTRVEGSDGAEVEIAANATGAVDREVRNGCTYRYRVQVEYASSNGTVRSEGVQVYGQPAERPKPLGGLTTRIDGGAVKIDYSQPSQGSVSIVACQHEPPVEPGQEIVPSQVGQLGRMLASGAGSALDDAPEKIVWYLPVTIAGGVAVVGHGVRHVSLPAIDNVQALENAGKVRVTWEWPSEAKLARVVWRQDRQPDGPDDPKAEGAAIRKGQYRDAGGFTIEPGAPGSLFVAVYPGVRVDGEVVIGSLATKRSRATARGENRIPVSYEVRQTGLLKKQLILRVSGPDGSGELPSMVLVGRPGDILPHGPQDGEILATIGGANPLSATVEMKGRPTPLAVRLFVETAASAGSYSVKDPAAATLILGG